MPTKNEPPLPNDKRQAGRSVHALPKAGAWVAELGSGGDCPRVAQVRKAYPEHDALDLIFYASHGERIGRGSPAMGGPKNFEPFCGAEWWVEVEKPPFVLMAENPWGWRHLLTPVRDEPAQPRKGQPL